MPLVPPRSRGAYTPEEVAKHNTPDSLWVVMNRKVYDVTAFHKRHPGGPAVMLQLAGKDATEAAAAAHKNALPGNLMWEFCIGSIMRTKRRLTEKPEVVAEAVGAAASKALLAAPASTTALAPPSARSGTPPSNSPRNSPRGTKPAPSGPAPNGDQKRREKPAAAKAEGPAPSQRTAPEPKRWNSNATVGEAGLPCNEEGGLSVPIEALKVDVDGRAARPVARRSRSRESLLARSVGDDLKSTISNHDSETKSRADGAVQGSSVGSRRDDLDDCSNEDDEDDRSRPVRSPKGLKAAQLTTATTADVRAVGEPDPPPEPNFRDVKATQSGFCSWPIACRLLPLSLQVRA